MAASRPPIIIIITSWLQKDAMAPAHYVGGLAILGFVPGLLPLSRRGHVTPKDRTAGQGHAGRGAPGLRQSAHVH